LDLLSHLALALAIQLLVARCCKSWGAGAAAAIAWAVAREITQADLANAIGVSRSAVSLWLEGKVGVPRPVAMLLRMLVAAQRRAFSAPLERARANPI
jgi:transcriptional regulator with XRE-family HTH domain